MRRPGIRELLETDLDILMGLAYLIERHLPSNEVYEPTTIVKEARRTLLREIDFTREGIPSIALPPTFPGTKRLLFPKYSGSNHPNGVPTMEYIVGIKVSDLEQLKSSGYDPKSLRAMALSFSSASPFPWAFSWRPTPWQYFCTPTAIRFACLISAWSEGLATTCVQQLVDLLLALLARDADRIISQLLYSGELTEDVSIRDLKRDLTDFIDDYYEIPPANQCRQTSRIFH
ncbi:MAG: AarF/UbiB family protein [Comamonadaceae bacterium]|nr:AarF/UbiB family protein [Comamonadaceae bacterium]